MKKYFYLFAFAIMISSLCKAQKVDSLELNVIDINELRTCFIFKTIRSTNPYDTIYIASEKYKRKLPHPVKIEIGHIYIFKFSEVPAISSPRKNMEVVVGGSIVWTSKKPWKEIPKIALNTDGLCISIE